MNSHERFEAVLSNRKPDKMPFYFPSIVCSVASELLGREVDSGGASLHFKEELSWLSGKNAHDEFVKRYWENAIELNRMLKADVVRQTWRMSQKPTKKLDDYTLLFGDINGPHIIKRYDPVRQTYGVVEDTTGPSDVDELEVKLKAVIKTDTSVTEDELEEIYADQLAFKKLAEPYFPCIVSGLNVGIPMTKAIWLEAVALIPDLLAEYIMHGVQRSLHHVRFLASKGYRWINDGLDMATSTGPVYSPAFFRKAVAPAIKLLVEECDKYGIHFAYGTDGNIWSIADYLFVEAGCKAFCEADRDAGMTVGKIREKYPDVVVLGNISSVTLHTGTEEDVRRETRVSLEESGGLNYIAGPSNAIVHGTPVRNIYAMLEEIESFKP